MEDLFKQLEKDCESLAGSPEAQEQYMLDIKNVSKGYVSNLRKKYGLKEEAPANKKAVKQGASALAFSPKKKKTKKSSK